MYHRVTEPVELFDEQGLLANPGWATKAYWNYNPLKMAASRTKSREWDYYLIANENYGISFSIAYTGNVSRMTVNFLDYEHGYNIRKNAILYEDIHQPGNEEGTVYFRNNDAEGVYIRKPGKHYIKIRFDNFDGEKQYLADVVLDAPETEEMVIATPFDEDKTCFFYNIKHNCMKASGTLRLGSDVYEFTPNRSFAVLDWGRGVWPDHNRWYWGSGSGVVDGKDFGFNLGYGFGNLTHATENMIFYDGKAHKFDQIVFHIPSAGYMLPWTINSNDNRFVMDFVPVFDRFSEIDLPNGASTQHQVFGKFTGTAVLDDGTELEIKDFFGFAEDVVNNWESI